MEEWCGGFEGLERVCVCVCVCKLARNSGR